MHLLLSFLLIIKVFHLSPVRGDICPPPPSPSPPVLKPPTPGQTFNEHARLRYQCQDGYVRKAGNSSLIRCERKDGVLQWTPLSMECIRDPRITATTKASTTQQTTTTHFSVSTATSPKQTTLTEGMFQMSSIGMRDPDTETKTDGTTVTTSTTDGITFVEVGTSSVASSSSKAVSTDVCFSSTTLTSSSSSKIGGIGPPVATCLVLSILAIIAMLILAIFFLCRRRKRRSLERFPTEEEEMKMNVVESLPTEP